MPPPAILVVDDEPNNFDVIETILSNADYALYYAAGGSVALRMIESVRPDVILLDVMMPDIDGIEVCRQIKMKEEWATIPIIMVTALNSKQDLANCLRTGADDFISKPVNSVELRARLHSMLRIKQQYDHLESYNVLQQNTIKMLNLNLEALRGNLTTALPHELNTPLHGIMMALEILIEDFRNSDDLGTLHLLELSHRSAKRLDATTQRFLRYASLELLRTQPKTVEYTPSSFVKDLVSNRILNNKDKVDLVCKVESAELTISKTYFGWILEELIDNAVKFSKAGTTISIAGQVDINQKYLLSVHNHGRGMTHEQIMNVGAFMQFERSKYEQQGSGLGLIIARTVIELYNGIFNISSIYNQELTVHISLPVATDRY